MSNKKIQRTRKDVNAPQAKGDNVLFAVRSGGVFSRRYSHYQKIGRGERVMEREEFEGNIMITISPHEIRIWVCNKNGENIFRFKALGKVYRAGNDVTILTNEK